MRFLIIWNLKVSCHLLCLDMISLLSERHWRYNLWSCQNVYNDLHYPLYNSFIRFGSKFYRQIVGIPVGTKWLVLQICFVFPEYHTWPGTPYGRVTLTQENITHKKAKRSVFYSRWSKCCEEQPRQHNKDKHKTEITKHMQKTEKRVWSGNTPITHCRPTRGTRRKSHKLCTVTRIL